MTELELSNEFLSLVESMEMPAYMLDAIVEAFGQSHEVDRTPMSKEEIKLRLDAMEQGNRMMGMPFDRKAAEADMIAKPWKYKSKPLPKKNRPTMDQFMQTANTQLPTQKEARDKYYKAVLTCIFGMMTKYNLPCSTGALIGSVKGADRRAEMPELSVAELRRANVLKPFASLQDAANDPVVQKLCQSNNALNQRINEAVDFMIGLGQAQANGMTDAYLFKARKRYQAKKEHAEQKFAANMAEHDRIMRNPSAMEDEAAKKAKEAQVAKQVNEFLDKAEPNRVKANYDTMADALKDNPNMEYKDVVDLVGRRGMSAEMMGGAPRPDESVFSFLSRVKPNEGEMMMEFCNRMKNVMGAAYKHGEVDEAYDQLKNSRNPDDKRVFDLAEESFGKTMLAPKDEHLYVLWKAASLRQAA